MTVLDERPQTHGDEMDPELFETLAAIAAREQEGMRLEFVGGKLGVRDVPDGEHDSIAMWLVRQCLQHRPELDLFTTGRGLKVETYRKGRARPDGVLAPVGHFLTAGEWADPEGVLMTVEITSHDQDTNQRDRVDKPRAYAESGIPVYLLIDRGAGMVTVFSEPVDGAYQDRHTAAFGKCVELPEPVGFALDTETLKEWTEQA